MRRQPGLLVIGLDAAEPSMLKGWASRLPNITEIQQRGLTVPLENEPSYYAGSTWPSLSTGTRTERHGRYYFKHYNPATYGDDKFSSSDLREPAIWTRLSDLGRRVAIIDVPKSPFRVLKSRADR